MTVMDAGDWDRRYEGTELLWSAQPNRFLVAEAQGLAPGRALDLACGEGRNAIWLAELGWDVTGVDFSAVAVGKAEQLAAARGVAGEFEVADLLTYQPAEQAFDLVIVSYLQVITAARAVILRRAGAAVAPSGTFLLVAHDRRNLEEGYGGPRDPNVLYTAEDVVADLDGLEVERAEPVLRPVETPEGERVAIDALVRARRVAGSFVEGVVG